MIIVDKALEQRQESGNPIRVGMVGAGFMGRGIALQILNVVPGMELVAISNRHLDGARRAYAEAEVENAYEVETVSQLEDHIADGKYAITEDAYLLARSENIDVLLEVTGSLEFSTGVLLEAIKHKKHVVLMNAELDGTIGPLLKVYARREGVVYTNVDGDQSVYQRRWGPARGHYEPVQICQRHWGEARTMWQYQGPSRPISKSHNARKLC